MAQDDDDRVPFGEWLVHAYVGLVVLFYTMSVYNACMFGVPIDLARALRTTAGQWPAFLFFAVLPGLVVGFFPVLICLLLAALALFGDHLDRSIRLPCESIFAVPVVVYVAFLFLRCSVMRDHVLASVSGGFKRTEPERETNMPPDAEEKLRSEIIGLRARNPDFPPVPAGLADYGGWFVEVGRRAALRSKQRTVDEQLKLLQKITAFHEEYLRLVRAKGDISRLPRTQRLEDRKLDVEEKRVECEMAELQERMRGVHRARAPVQAPDPVAALREEILTRVRSLAELDQLEARIKRDYPEVFSNPRIASQIARMFEQARIRLSR